VTEKTNAIRVLEAEGIAFDVRTYDIDEEDLSAESAAEALGLAPEQVFKTLVVQGDRSGPMLVLLPAGTEVDFKRLAKTSNDKKVEMVPLREVQALTGYVRGALTPLAIHRAYSVYIDETVTLWPKVGISAGAKGLEVLLAPEDLLRVTGALMVDIARSSWSRNQQ
jgi:Cys-tRNA(Pro)/Cys-tRNA(Cys) deacylase